MGEAAEKWGKPNETVFWKAIGVRTRLEPLASALITAFLNSAAYLRRPCGAVSTPWSGAEGGHLAPGLYQLAGYAEDDLSFGDLACG